MYEDYLKEANSIVSRWEKTNLLAGIESVAEQQQMALVLENQRLFNEVLFKEFENKTDEHLTTEEVTKRDTVARFARISIPLIRRIFGEFVPFKLVSVQTLLNSTGKLYYMDQMGIIRETEVIAKNGIFKSKMNQAPMTEYSLDEEAQRCADCAVAITTEITRQVLVDLRLNAGSVLEHKWTGPEQLFDMTVLCSTAVDKKIGRSANWIVTSPMLADYLTDFGPLENAHEQLDRPCYRGTLVGAANKKWNLYVDPVFPNQILMGYKGADNLTPGYFYNPYIVLSNGPNYSESGTIITRYGKKLLNNSHYARIDVSGL